MLLLVKWERPIRVIYCLGEQPISDSDYTQRGDFTLDVDDDLTINQIRDFALLEIDKTKLREREVSGVIKMRIEL